MNQSTIAEKISCTGIGLHSGKPVQITLYPARADTGVVFVRTDLPHPVEIPARPDFVTSTCLATTLGRGSATVATVEHLLAAVYGLGIHNLRVEVDGPELPVMDGSAASFVYLLRSAGLFTQPTPRRRLRILETLEVREGAKRIRIAPGRGLRIDYAVDYRHPAIGRQALTGLRVDADGFERELARARTFGFLDDVETLWRMGRGRGGNLDNTVVLDVDRVLNRGGLRWVDEFVRHKALDLVGDLALLGVPVDGHVSVECGGHGLHQALLMEILSTPTAWSVEEPAARAPLGAHRPAFAAPAGVGA